MPSPSPTRVLTIVTGLHFATHLYWTFLQPLNPELKEFFGLELDRAIASLYALQLVVYAASNLLAGYLSTRWSPRVLLALGPGLNGVAVAAMWLLGPGSFGGMCALTALGAFGGGFYHPVAGVLLASAYPDNRGKAFGISGSGAALSFVVGPWLASGLVRTAGWSWQDVTLLYGGLGTALGALAWFAVPASYSIDHSQRPAKSADNPAATAGLRAVWLFAALMVLAAAGREIATWGTGVITRQYAEAAFAPQAPDAGWLLALWSLPGLVVQPLAGRWSDKLGRERLLAASLAVLSLAIFALPLMPCAWVGLPYVVAGAAMAASVPTFEALLADRTPVAMRGIVFGFVVTTGIAIGAGGTVLAGAVADWGDRTAAAYRDSFRTLAALAGLGFVLTLTLRPAARRLGLLAKDEG